MRTLLLLISLIGFSVVLGLPVTEKNARAVEFDDEFHDEAETLIQNFDDLSERLKAVENELKEGLEVNSMQHEDFNLKEFDDIDDSAVDGTYHQAAAAINRHFESDKMHMAGKMRHRPAVHINEEDEQTGQTGDRESTQTHTKSMSGTKKCDESELEGSKTEYLPESDIPDEVEYALKKVKDHYPHLLDTNPEYYIEDYKDHSVCFIYEEDQEIGYVVIHEKSSGEFEFADKQPGSGICTCYNLGNALTTAMMEEINKPAVKTMWDEWNENNERGGYANRQEGVDPDDYISDMQEEDETTPSNTHDSDDEECDPSKNEGDLEDYVLNANKDAEEALTELKSRKQFEDLKSSPPLSFIESKDTEHTWHCFLYPVDVDVTRYIVAHKTAEGYKFKDHEGRDICTCKSLADALIDGDGKDVAVMEDKHNSPMKTMWVEWKNENRNNVRNQWRHKNRWENDDAQEQWEDRNQWKLRNRQEAQEEQYPLRNRQEAQEERFPLRNHQEAYGQEAKTSRGRNQWRNNMVAHRQQHLERMTGGEKMRYNGNQMAYRQNGHRTHPEGQWRNNNRVMAQQHGRMRYNGNPLAGARQQHVETSRSRG